MRDPHRWAAGLPADAPVVVGLGGHGIYMRGRDYAPEQRRRVAAARTRAQAAAAASTEATGASWFMGAARRPRAVMGAVLGEPSWDSGA